MDILIAIGRIAYVLIFFLAVFYSVKFQFGEESNDERGRKILNNSYGFAFPFVLLGWFFITVVDDYIVPLSFDQYKMSIWILVTGTYILHAFTLFILNKKS